MRAQHIVVGEDYEVKVWSSRERATVLEIGKITKRVGYHITFEGYNSSRTRVRVRLHGWQDREEVIETNQVLRPWSEVESILEEQKRLDEEFDKAIKGLQKLMKRIGVQASVSRAYSYVHHKPVDHINVSLSLRDTHRLRQALRGLPKARRERSTRATRSRDSLE